MALYPDNVGLGRSLGTLAINRTQIGGLKTSGMLPLRDLLVAVNVRTAEHLGLDLVRRGKQEFDLMFPAP